jgi:superfamily II RNA helicase
MAGRAGRRGKDTKGSSLIYLSEGNKKFADLNELREMFDN